MLKDMLLIILSALCYHYILKLHLILPQKVEKLMKDFPTLTSKGTDVANCLTFK